MNFKKIFKNGWICFKTSLAIFLIFIAFFPPAYFLYKELKPQEIFTYEASKKWQVQNGDINTFPGCAYILFNKYIAYCADDKKTEANSDLEAIRIDKKLEVKNTLLSKMFGLSNIPMENKICFDVDNYFEGYPEQKFESETRLFIYKKPISNLNEISESDTIVETLGEKRKCITAMSGMTLFALGPAETQFFNENFYKGLLKAGKFKFMKDESNIINYAFSGDLLFINGVKAAGKLTEIRKGEFVYSANLYEDEVDFNIVKKVVVTSRIIFNQKLILTLIVFSVWFLILAGIIDNIKKIFGFIISLLPNFNLKKIKVRINNFFKPKAKKESR